MLLNTKSCLHSVKTLTEVARTRIGDEAFGESFFRSISKNVEEAEFLLDNFVQFLSVNTPLKKRGTVHRVIEELLKKHQIQLDKKGVRITKKYEQNLLETVVANGPLSYILESVLQYGIGAVTPGGEIEFTTKSSKLEKDMSVRKRVSREDKRYIGIRMLFKSTQKQGEPVAETPSAQEPLTLMLLRLAEEVLRKNQGIMKFEEDQKHGKLSISLWLPSERREKAYDRSIESVMK